MMLGETAVIRYRRSSQKSDLLDSKLLISQTLLVPIVGENGENPPEEIPEKHHDSFLYFFVANCVASIGLDILDQ